MSIWRAVVSVLVLVIAACADAPVAATDESAVEQATRIPPVCLDGDILVTWTEPVGVCGTCSVGGIPGQPTAHYAACANEIDTTKTQVKSTCEPPC